MKEKKKMSLAMQIFIALVLAIAAGLLMQRHAQFAETYIKPFGTIFLNLLKFIVVPIVLFSIMCGIISMRDIKKVGAIGLKTVVYYMCTTAFAITFGLIGGNLFKKLFPVIATTELSYEIGEKTSLMDTIVNIFPSNFISPMAEANMLQVIVMAILIGFAIILVGDEKNDRIITACNDLNDILVCTYKTTENNYNLVTKVTYNFSSNGLSNYEVSKESIKLKEDEIYSYKDEFEKEAELLTGKVTDLTFDENSLKYKLDLVSYTDSEVKPLYSLATTKREIKLKEENSKWSCN